MIVTSSTRAAAFQLRMSVACVDQSIYITADRRPLTDFTGIKALMLAASAAAEANFGVGLFLSPGQIIDQIERFAGPKVVMKISYAQGNLSWFLLDRD